MLQSYDYILVGGGLQNGLIALAVLDRRPNARICLIERDDRLGGNHTWCFHADDVGDAAGAWVGPLVVYRWSGYDVRFPALARTLEAPYAGITSEHFDQLVQRRFHEAPSADLLLGTSVADVDAHRVTLADGRSLTGRAVIDARGPIADPDSPAGFQKFVGVEVDLATDHDLERPVLMDATVDQTHGFRFLYVLPLGPRRVLLEDTYFHDDPDLDDTALIGGILAYAEAIGLAVEGVARTERGVLPMPWAGDTPSVAGGPLVAGYRGGWFHPATGYSFPTALRLAVAVADADPDDLYRGALTDLAATQSHQMHFAFRLNRMLFHWFAPGKRVHVFERFYRLPEPLIRRFYALELSGADRARILVGRPPKGMSWRAVFNLGAPR